MDTSISKIMPKRCECNGCIKKLNLCTIKCKCDKYFCDSHRYSSEHNCEYNYNSEHINKLKNQLIKIESDKINKI